MIIKQSGQLSVQPNTFPFNNPVCASNSSISVSECLSCEYDACVDLCFTHLVAVLDVCATMENFFCVSFLFSTLAHFVWQNVMKWPLSPVSFLFVLFSNVWVEEIAKHSGGSATMLIAVCEFLSMLTIAGAGRISLLTGVVVRVIVSALHFAWADSPFGASLLSHMTWNVIAFAFLGPLVTAPGGRFRFSQAVLNAVHLASTVSFFLAVIVLGSALFRNIRGTPFSPWWFLSLAAAIVWVTQAATLSAFTIFSLYSTWISAGSVSFLAPFEWFATACALFVLGAHVFVILPPVVASVAISVRLWFWPPSPLRPPLTLLGLRARDIRKLKRRLGKSLASQRRFYEPTLTRHFRDPASMPFGWYAPSQKDSPEDILCDTELHIDPTDRFVCAGDFMDQSALYVAENVALLVRDFFRVRSWGDYVALAMRIHHLLRPGVSVGATLAEELLYLRNVAGFTSDPFADSAPDYVSAGATEFMEGAFAWHRALMCTSFGRSMAMLLQGLFASAMLTQSRSALRGAAWVHLLLGQNPLTPPAGITLATLVEWAMRALEQLREVRDMILPALRGGDPARIFDPGDRLTQATCRVRQAIAAQAEYLDISGVHFDPQGWVDELEACEAFVLDFLRDKDVKPWDQSALRKLLSDLTVTLVDARKRAVHLQCRKQPFFIFAVGAPGVGKTDNIENAGFSCLMRNGDAIPANHTYTVTGSVKFHDGYNGNEPMVRVEDPTLSIQQEFDPLQFVSMMKSRYPYAPNMAAVELKNSRFAAPKILMVTSNETNPAVNRQRPSAAFARRIDLHATFFVNPEFQDEHGIGLDPVKIAARENGDYYRVVIGKWVTDKNMGSAFDPSVHLEYESDESADGKVAYTTEIQRAKFYNPVEFNDRAATMYVAHVARETRAVALKNARRDQMCSKCNVAWATHGTMGCPYEGVPVTYDNPSNKLRADRWKSAAFPPAIVTTWRSRAANFLSFSWVRAWIVGALAVAAGLQSGGILFQPAGVFWWSQAVSAWSAAATLPLLALGAAYSMSPRPLADGFIRNAMLCHAVMVEPRLRAAAWNLCRGRGDVWDAAALAGLTARPDNQVVIARLLRLRDEPWFRLLVGGATAASIAMIAVRLMRAMQSDEDLCKSAGAVASRVPWVKPEAWAPPPRSKRVSGTNLEKVQADVDGRIVSLDYEARVEGRGVCAVGIRIGGCMVLTHRHAYDWACAGGTVKSVSVRHPSAGGPNLRWVPREHEVYRAVKGDYVVFRIDALNPVPFFPYFAQNGYVPTMALATARLLREAGRLEPVAEWRPWTPTCMARGLGEVGCDNNGVVVVSTKTWELPCDARIGDCGSPLLAADGTFMGICVATSALGNRPPPVVGLFQGFDQSDFKLAHEALRGETPIFDVDESLKVYSVTGGEPVLGELSARSSLRRIPDGTILNAEPVGTLSDYHCARAKSGMEKTPFEPHVSLAFPHTSGKWAPPSGDVCQVGGARYDPFDRMLADMVDRSMQHYDPELMARVRDAWVDKVAMRIPAMAGELRASLHACLNGDELMKRVDLSTSSGFLNGGAKSLHVDVAGEESGKVYTLKPDAQRVWDGLGDAYSRRVAPCAMVRVFLKLNEVRPAEKIAAGGTRTINCIPFPLNLRVKSVFGRLSAYLQRYKVVTGMMIGLNAAGPELDEVLAGMCGQARFTPEMADEEWWADWDTKHQDLSVDRRLLLEAVRALAQLAERLGATSDVVDEMYFWGYVLSVPAAAMKGGDLVRMAWNSSGHQLTTEFNSLIALFGYIYACALVVGLARALLELFIIVYGDDVLMRVSRWLRERMRPEDWVRGLAEYGLTITPGSKRADDKGEYRALGACTFLKRRFSLVDVGEGRGIWTAALEEDSILKGLSWYEPSDRAQIVSVREGDFDMPLPRAQQLCEILRNAQYEWWAYGRDVFEARTSWIQSVARSSGFHVGVKWRSYDEITNEYYDGRYTTMSL